MSVQSFDKVLARVMAAPGPLTAAQQGHLETLAPDLRFQLEQADVPAVLQARLGELGVRNVALFSGLDETRDSVRAALMAELPLDPSAGVTERLNMARLLAAWEASRLHLQVSEKNKAEARLGTQQRLVQPNEHHAMRLAVEVALGKLKDDHFRLADFSFNFRKLICRAFGEACKAQLNDLFH